MEKTPYNAPYPQMPPEMNAVGASSTISVQHTVMATSAPPTYEQATYPGGNYPPVQVLPTPAASSFNRPQPTPQSFQPQPQPAPANTQVFVGAVPNAQYVGVTTVGGAGWSVPQPNSYPRQQQQHQQGVPMVQQPVVIVQQQAILQLGPRPTNILCPYCHVRATTRVDHEPNSKTHLMAALMCVLGLWCCVCLPYCVDSCMNTNHYCGNCNKFLGTFADPL